MMTSTTATPMLPRLDLMPVRNAMHAGLVGCDPGATVPVIAGIFAERRIHCVVVRGIERTLRGERLTWGVVSDRDLMRALDATDRTVTAGSLAGSPPLTVEPEEPLSAAVQLMASSDVTHVVVVEDDYPIGIVSALDVARAAAA